MAEQSANTLSWPKRLIFQAKQDPKRSGIMCVLLLVLVIMVLRLTLLGGGAAKALASQGDLPASPSIVQEHAASDAVVGEGVELTRSVVPGRSKITRNIFRLNSSLYPSGDSGGSVRLTEKDDSAQNGEQRLHRLAIQAEAAVLTLQSTIVRGSPSAIINGRVVRLGRTIGGFTVVAVSARTCVISKDGVKVTLEMKRWQNLTEIGSGD